MIRPDQVGLTQSLQMLAAQINNPKEQQEFLQRILDGIVTYIQQYQEALSSGERKSEVLKGFYELMDEITADFDADTKNMITCKKGCSFCCHMNVDVTKTEVTLMLEHARKNNIAIDIDRLKRQKDLTTETHFMSTHSACTFLQTDGTCGVYEVRPLACRKYFAASDPKLCNGKKNPTGHVASYADEDLEIIASAIISIDRDFDSMARVILGILEPKPVVNSSVADFIDEDDSDD